MESKINIPKGFMKYFYKYGYKYRFYIAMITFFSIIESVVTVISPWIMGKTINILQTLSIPEGTDIKFKNLAEFLAILAGLYFLYSISRTLKRYFSTFVTEKISYALRNDVSAKINRLRLSYIETTSYGEILSRSVSDVEAISSALTEYLGNSISSIILSIGIISMMFFVSPEMSWVYFGFLPFIFLLIFIPVKKSKKYIESFRENIGKIATCAEESFSGFETLKNFDLENNYQKKFENINNNMFESDWKSNFLPSLTAPVIGFIRDISTLISCALGGYLVVIKGMPLGNIMSFLSYSGQLMEPIAGMAGIYGTWQNICVSASRVYEILHAPEETSGFSEEIKDMNSEKILEFSNVSFEYEKDKLIIDNISFSVSKGQIIALVGETGAGKSTVLKLLTNFYKPKSGKILFSGVDINSISLENYRKNFGIVTQDSWLYKDTIMNNIRYGNLNASDEKIIEVSKKLGIHHFIETLPESYATIVDESMINLSEGQKQLICIARLVISEAPIFVLDEATSFIDTCTESHIQEILKSLFKQKTSLVVAHRLSTVKNADMILVMKKGKIVESGSHEDLMNKNQYYADFYESQYKI